MSDAPDPSRPKAHFRSDAFVVSSLEEAMTKSLTPQHGVSTHERWGKETDFHLQDLARFVQLGPETTVLDYGCGPGRMAKALIDRHGLRVIGVDSSPTMALHATEYVLSERL